MRCSELSKIRSRCFLPIDRAIVTSTGSSACSWIPKYVGQRMSNELRIIDEGELDKPDAVLEVVHKLGAQLEGEASLPESAGSGDRHDAVREESVVQCVQLLFPPNEVEICDGKLLGWESSDASAGNSTRSPGPTS